MVDDPPHREPPVDPPAWQPPSGQPPPTQYGQPQYGQPQYGQPQYGQPPPQGFPGYAPPPGYAQPQGYYQQPSYAQAPAVPSWGPVFADKPGIIPLRPLAVGEILDGVFSTIRQNTKALLGLTFLVVLVGEIIDLVLKLSVNGASDGARLVVTLISYLIQNLTATVATGVAIIVISEAVLGTRIAPAEVLNRLQGRIWRLVGLSFLVALLTILANVAILYVAVLLSFATSVFVLERTTIREALSRSAQLVRGSWWRTFGIGFLGYLVGLTLAGIVGVPFTIFAASSSGLFSGSGAVDISTGGQVLLAVGGLIGGTISTPIIAGTISLIYIDRRIRREGLDLVLVQTARERQGRS